ncbi:hypothetical protein FORC31_p042 (plasmid) [Escherichia coli]|nr:hypothetical protein FORC31_p042 [Escherichia coli]
MAQIRFRIDTVQTAGADQPSLFKILCKCLSQK